MTTQQTNTPDMVKAIEGITFIVRAHFLENQGETMQEKIERMLRNEVACLGASDEFSSRY